MLRFRASHPLVAALVPLSLLPILAAYSCEQPEAHTPRGQWPVWGGNLHNTHDADGESAITTGNVATLQPRWVFDTIGNVSAIPTVADGRVYAVDWGLLAAGGGKLYAIDQQTGHEIWSRSILSYTGNLLTSISRTSPAISGNLLVIGDLRSQPTAIVDVPGGAGASLYAIDRNDGHLVWRTTLDPHPLAVVTQSPVVYRGRVYVGVSSQEEAAARLAYPCCSFRGSMVAVDLATGAIVWQRYTTPPNGGQPGGFSGVAVWGSSPPIDAARNVVYAATGNNYSVPEVLESCLVAHAGDPEGQQHDCYDPLDPADNYADSIVALDLDTGAVRWAHKMRNYGAWTFACDKRIAPWLITNPENCRDLEAQDFDFGQAPMLYTANVGGAARDLVAAGQKSGVFWALNPDDGSTVWTTSVGPGGVLGGMEFGAATDGRRIYTQVTNIDHTEFALTAGEHAGQVARGGIWAALDAATGELLWQTPDPSSLRPLTGDIVHPVWGAGLGDGFFGVAIGPMTVAAGVVYGGSFDREGHMYALDAATGQILWSFASGGSVMSAPAIAGGMLFWGSGYQQGFNNNKLYAFGLPR
jgi:polyvinyl alcohol dehydrogenase (cytochrome)